MHPGLLLALAALLAWILWTTRWSASRDRIAGVAGCLVLAAALVSPLCALSVALFSARSLHHLLLVAVAAPLFAMAVPRSGPASGSTLAAATFGQAAVLWAWHLPVAYQFALTSDLVYLVMEVSLLGSATWFWRAILASTNALGACSVLLATMIQMGFLGALLTFAPRPFYEAHFLTTAAFGLSPLLDQQLAGLLMWVPPVLVYGGATLVTVALVAGGRNETPLARA